MILQLERIKMILGITLLGIFIASCGDNQPQSTSKAPVKVTAQIASAQLADYPLTHSFSGNLEADKRSNLSTRIMGQISAIHVKNGDKVKQGQLLIQIRNNDLLAKQAQLKANKKEASTAFESAEKDLKRYEALHATNSASNKELEDMQTRFRMAKARVDAISQMEKELEENLRYSSIRAPYSGVITNRFAEVGDLANPGMPLLSIENASQWKVIARIPEADISKINLNDSVQVNFKAVNRTFKGQIIEINPSTSHAGNQYEAKVLVYIPDNCNARLYSGMYANVLFEYGTQERILIPQSALVRRGQLTGLYAVSQTGNALLRWVNTGKNYNNKVEILSGLTHGEQYIQRAEGKLFDGALVANY